jgi:hypothetical protein
MLKFFIVILFFWMGLQFMLFLLLTDFVNHLYDVWVPLRRKFISDPQMSKGLRNAIRRRDAFLGSWFSGCDVLLKETSIRSCLQGCFDWTLDYFVWFYSVGGKCWLLHGLCLLSISSPGCWISSIFCLCGSIFLFIQACFVVGFPWTLEGIFLTDLLRCFLVCLRPQYCCRYFFLCLSIVCLNEFVILFLCGRPADLFVGRSWWFGLQEWTKTLRTLFNCRRKMDFYQVSGHFCVEFSSDCASASGEILE